jgi:hypothetical protein
MSSTNVASFYFGFFFGRGWFASGAEGDSVDR